MFRRILIANRAAIACRIIRTCRRMGVESVAVRSPAEPNALHAALADVAVDLPEMASPVAGYLDIDAIIDAALRTGADAIHPGYGFLSENPDFARACADAGIVFIGPPPAVISGAGNKREAQTRLIAAGVPMLTGVAAPRDDADAAEFDAVAASIGLPIMVKAAEGGGGIGMNIVEDPARLARAVSRTRSSARRAFDSEDVYLERYISSSRHVEVQVLAGANGDAAHLWERECSVQRRHQKVIEEAPSPSIADATRYGLVNAALAAAREVGYVNAGTFEFIVAPDDDYYFLEINTRIQVEHGVTEMITGVDIVERQLRIAAGETSPLDAATVASPDGPDISGHAIQCRIYAEDPDTFIPSPGPLEEFYIPDLPNLRVDTGFRMGDEVSLYFDPLLAKMIAWGQTRADAIALMRSALTETRISGVKTNIPALEWSLRHPAFIAGHYDTGLLDEKPTLQV